MWVLWRCSDWDFFFPVSTYTTKEFSQKKNTLNLILGAPEGFWTLIREMKCGQLKYATHGWWQMWHHALRWNSIPDDANALDLLHQASEWNIRLIISGRITDVAWVCA